MDELDEVRALCLALPGTTETVKAGGRPVWQVGGAVAEAWRLQAPERLLPGP